MAWVSLLCPCFIVATIFDEITLWGVPFTSWPDLLLAWPNLELKDF